MKLLSVASLVIFLQSVSLVSAWLPKDKGYFSPRVPLRTNSTSPASRNSTSRATHRSHIDKRYIPGFEIRGVNLGSLFIVEPWMASTEWSNMGCGSSASEFDCTMLLGQDQANAVFQSHWASWITQGDIWEMVSYGLNSIRIPLGYWIFQDLVYSDSEHFPQGQLSYLEQVCGWAAEAGMYVILDLHGAPGAQVADNADTGQYASTPGFYEWWQYERAYWFLGNMTELIFNGEHPNYASVGMLEVVNEPLYDDSMLSEYYPNAMAAIRAVEDAYGVAESDRLHIQFMDERYGSGDPDEYLTDLDLAAYDDHSYFNYDSAVTQTQAGYLSAACTVSVGTNWPEVVGEWCVEINPDYQDTSEFDPNAYPSFYQDYWAAQIQAYETQDGWIFWSWKTNLGDYRWDYQLAVQDGIFPTNIDDAYNFDCSPYR